MLFNLQYLYVCIVIQFSTSLSDVHLDWTTCNMVDYYLLHSAMFTKTSPPVIWSYSSFISCFVARNIDFFNSWSYIYSYGIFDFNLKPAQIFENVPLLVSYTSIGDIEYQYWRNCIPYSSKLYCFFSIIRKWLAVRETNRQ